MAACPHTLASRWCPVCLPEAAGFPGTGQPEGEGLSGPPRGMCLSATMWYGNAGLSERWAPKGHRDIVPKKETFLRRNHHDS